MNKESLETGGNFEVRTKREKCLIMGSRGVPAKPTSTRQSTLDAALNKNAKKVTFQDVDSKNMRTEIEDLREQNKKLKEKLQKLCKKSEEEMKEIERKFAAQRDEINELKDKSGKLEEKVDDLGKTVKEWSERLDATLSAVAETEASEDSQLGDVASEGASGSAWPWSLKSDMSRKSRRSVMSGGKSKTSSVSGASDGFTEREVFKMKNMLYEKDRLDRACNIVLEGVNEQIGTIEKNKNEEGQNDFKGWAEKFLAMKLSIQIKIVSARASGSRERVIIAKLENEEEKTRVMMNKTN